MTTFLFLSLVICSCFSTIVTSENDASSLSFNQIKSLVATGGHYMAYFYKSAEANLQQFISQLSTVSSYLHMYGITVVKVHCQEGDLDSTYCAEDSQHKFLYGFKDGEEKIALPVESVFEMDSIIASALHLVLLEDICIIHSRADLELVQKRHWGSSDIIIGYFSSLGSSDHRVFTEVAYQFITGPHSQNKQFCITTSPLATGHLRRHVKYNGDADIWLLQCQNPVQDTCIESQFLGSLSSMKETSLFIQSLHRKAVIDISDPRGLAGHNFNSGFYCFVFYDVQSEPHVKEMSVSLSNMFRGTINVWTINVSKLKKFFILTQLVDLESTILPTFILRPNYSRKLTPVLRFEDPIVPILEEIRSRAREVPTEYSEEDDYEENKEDDEVSQWTLEHSEDVLEATDAIPEIRNLLSYLRDEPAAAVLFYFPFDAVSKVALVILHQALTKTKYHHSTSHVGIARVNCFDQPSICEERQIHEYPVLKLFRQGLSSTYTDQWELRSIMRAVHRLQYPFPIEVKTVEEGVKLLNTNPQDFLLLAVENSNNHSSHLFQMLGQYIIGEARGSVAVQLAQHFNTAVPFMCFTKPTSSGYRAHVVQDKLEEGTIQEEIRRHRMGLYTEIDENTFTWYLTDAKPTAVFLSSDNQNIGDKIQLSGEVQELFAVGWMNSTKPTVQSILKEVSFERDTQKLIVFDRQHGFKYMYPGEELDSNDIDTWLRMVAENKVIPSGTFQS